MDQIKEIFSQIKYILIFRQFLSEHKRFKTYKNKCILKDPTH